MSLSLRFFARIPESISFPLYSSFSTNAKKETVAKCGIHGKLAFKSAKLLFSFCAFPRHPPQRAPLFAGRPIIPGTGSPLLPRVSGHQSRR